MKVSTALFIFLFLLLMTVLIIIRASNPVQPGKTAEPVLPGEVPSTVVLPPEQLPQFKNISVYTPKTKNNSTMFINPRDNPDTSSEEYKKIQPGIM